MAKDKPTQKQVEALRHDATRKNIPSAEMQPVVDEQTKAPIRVAYERRNRDLDPQLVWRGKEHQDLSDLSVNAPPLYIQEKVHPKALVDDLLAETARRAKAADHAPPQLDLFADFNGLPEGDAKTEFYQHDGHWSNRMILGDSLQVMASLAEREGLRGKVQCVYFDPPYGIKFKSNWQYSTNSRDVKDGVGEHITREPQQVKAFRDTWKHGIHSYLGYLRERLTVCHDLLAPTGSLFLQIGDENVHRVRLVLDEVFGENNFISQIAVQTTSGFKADFLGNMSDFILWYGKDKNQTKVRHPYYKKEFQVGEGNARWLMMPDFTYRGVSTEEKINPKNIPSAAMPYKPDNIISQGRSSSPQPFEFRGKVYDTWQKNSHWKANYPDGMDRLAKANRIHVAKNSIQYIRYHSDFNLAIHGNIWTDTGTGNFTEDKIYVVQTGTKAIARCILMASDPGDLVLDPTCGSGTTAYVAEEYARRWITIDTSRVALALARARLMGARYPYYLLADSREGQLKEAELTRSLPSDRPTYGNIRQGFVYERAPHIMLGQIANNTEIDVIYDEFQSRMEPLRAQLNRHWARPGKNGSCPAAPMRRPSRTGTTLPANY
jgi:adenine-specific DNA-methyltransferase